MAFNEDKTPLVHSITAALHDLQTTAAGAGVKVQQVLMILDPDVDTEMVQYTWDKDAGKFDIATINDDRGSAVTSSLPSA